jgi:predicted TIM-barrel fold metal-dependent hydrolase
VGAPLISPRSYTPQIKTIADWRMFADAVGVDRGIIVQPSVYGRDNRVLLAALAARPRDLRGVVVVDAATSVEEFRRLHERGVRGARVNTKNIGGLTLEEAVVLASAISEFGWPCHFQVDDLGLEALCGLIPRLPSEAVIDHIGFISVEDSARRAEGVDRLLRLLNTGRVWIKLSGVYRLGGDRAAISNVVSRLVQANPERLIWGSDWPHTELWNDMPDDADLIEEMMGWLANPTLARQVLVENPARLYWPEGLEAPASSHKTNGER